MPMDELQLELPPVAASGVPGYRPGQAEQSNLVVGAGCFQPPKTVQEE